MEKRLLRWSQIKYQSWSEINLIGHQMYMEKPDLSFYSSIFFWWFGVSTPCFCKTHFSSVCQTNSHSSYVFNLFLPHNNLHYWSYKNSKKKKIMPLTFETYGTSHISVIDILNTVIGWSTTVTGNSQEFFLLALQLFVWYLECLLIPTRHHTSITPYFIFCSSVRCKGSVPNV